MKRQQPIAIVTPMEREAAPLRPLLRRAPFSGACLLGTCGAGKEAARRWAVSLGDGPQPPRMLLSMGFAGAIQPQAAPGQLLLSPRLWALGEREPVPAHPALIRLAEAACKEGGLPYQVGDQLTVSQPLCQAEEKARLGEATGAWVVTMEDYWLASGAAAAGVPFLAVRAVLDTAHQDLPSFVGSLGGHRPWGQLVRVLGGLGRRPWLLPRVVALAKQAEGAQGSLASFAKAFLPLALDEWQAEPVEAASLAPSTNAAADYL